MSVAASTSIGEQTNGLIVAGAAVVCSAVRWHRRSRARLDPIGRHQRQIAALRGITMREPRPSPPSNGLTPVRHR